MLVKNRKTNSRTEGLEEKIAVDLEVAVKLSGSSKYEPINQVGSDEELKEEAGTGTTTTALAEA